MAESGAPFHYDVLVVGAGIAGSALAVALSGQGLRIALVEARELPVDPGPARPGLDGFDVRVSALTQGSIDLLKRFAAWPAIEAYRVCAYRHMTVWDAEGTGRIDFDSAEMNLPALGTLVENGAVTRALADRVRRAPDIEVLAPRRLEQAQRSADGVVVTLDDGTRCAASLTVGADGALSPLRDLLNFATREWSYGQSAIVATVETERYHADTAWQRFLCTGPLALLPLPDSADRHYCSIVWSLDDDAVDPVMALSDADFCVALGEAAEHCLGDILASSPRAAFPLRQRHAINYVESGVALVADAAHTIHPLAGQGINLGLADVDELARVVLEARQRGLPLGALSVLQRYQRRRKGSNLAMMAAMDGFRHLFGSRRLPARWLRNVGLRQVDGLPALKKRLMRQAMGLAE
ncbi:MAG: UbiH/UbiF/VisC/COQ6 family ubiquinone biosynthesis hydroxylase [Chromatocurvus sp.]